MSKRPISRRPSPPCAARPAWWPSSHPPRCWTRRRASSLRRPASSCSRCPSWTTCASPSAPPSSGRMRPRRSRRRKRSRRRGPCSTSWYAARSPVCVQGCGRVRACRRLHAWPQREVEGGPSLGRVLFNVAGRMALIARVSLSPTCTLAALASFPFSSLPSGARLRLPEGFLLWGLRLLDPPPPPPS